MGTIRNLLNNFSTVATRLSGLTRKHSPNKDMWGGKLPRSISAVKKNPNCTTSSSYTNWSKLFILQTDASAYGLGYVLSQLDSQGKEHPIAFASKKLLTSERNYSAIKWEALAMVKGVQHFRTYLEGNPFTIQTDHNPITHLNYLNDSHGRLARWALAFQPYQLWVEHRSGWNNSNADGLSRDPNQQLRLRECQSYRESTQ